MTFRFDLTILKTRQNWIDALGVGEDVLNRVIAFEPPPDPIPGESPPPTQADIIEAVFSPFYKHRIPKRNKARGFRVAWEPALKNEYKKLATWLNGFFAHKLTPFPHPSTFGYVGGRSIKDNAAAHCGHALLLVVDIENFFGSIGREKIEGLFLSTGMTSEAADLLSRFLTIQGVLPLGLPTSPVISNAVFLPVDKELAALADAYDCVYTRYSDDLSFSGEVATPPIETVSEILARHGYATAAGKTRRSRRGQAHFVTGLSISDPEQPHVPRRMKHRLRQELYFARKYGLEDHLQRQGINDPDVSQREINRLDGLVKYVAHHEPRLSSRLKPLWMEILKQAGARPSYTPRHQQRSAFYIFADEAEWEGPGGRMLALGLAVSQHPRRLAAAGQAVLDAYLSDMFAAGDRMAIAKRGIHFADANEDLRLQYIGAMRAMPFEGYVAMVSLADHARYEETYLDLLRAVVRRRLMAAESQLACFVIEKNSKVDEEAVRGLIQDTWRQLKDDKNRHPRACVVEFVAKPHLGISVPDFLLGVLGKYLASIEPGPRKPLPRERLLFERIRDKYRLIANLDDGVEYSRRRPIQPWSARRALEPEMS